MKSARARIHAAATRWEFRAPRPGEPDAAYVAALIAHVETRNWAAAHELRVGRDQADWTPEDAAAFSAHLLAKPAALHETIRPQVLQIGELGQVDPTDETLDKIAESQIEFLRDQRLAAPHKQLPILLSVVLTTGAFRTTVLSSDDRIAVLKQIAAQWPLFGYAMTFDAYIHAFGGERATTRDCLLCHLGTRGGRRVVQRQPYRVVDGVVTFDAIAAIDFADAERFEDPYAFVFAMPTAPGKPS